MIYIFIFLFLVAFLLAWRSMKDFHIPKEVQKMTGGKRKKGTFVIFKNKVTHYKG